MYTTSFSDKASAIIWIERVCYGVHYFHLQLSFIEGVQKVRDF